MEGANREQRYFRQLFVLYLWTWAVKSRRLDLLCNDYVIYLIYASAIARNKKTFSKYGIRLVYVHFILWLFDEHLLYLLLLLRKEVHRTHLTPKIKLASRLLIFCSNPPL